MRFTDGEKSALASYLNCRCIDKTRINCHYCEVDFTIPEELQMLVDSVRRFREKELMPLEPEFLKHGKIPVETRIALEQKARKQGFWALDVPDAYGGQGLGWLGFMLVVEELYKWPGMFDFGGSVEPVLYELDDDQKQRYLYPIINENMRCCYAFTEPGAGSDLSAIRMTAVLDGDEWVLNGTKTFISHADRADFVIVFARTNPGAGAKGITCFIVDTDAAGLSMSPIQTMGDSWEPYELNFDNCRVPDRNRIGEVDKGWRLATGQLNHGRVMIAAFNLGIAARCIDIATSWATERSTWGKPLASRQSIQWMLADSLVELEAARLLVYKAAALGDAGTENTQAAFIAKLYATEMAQNVTDRCLQILGGMGYSKELAVQSFYRQVRVWRIGHGTSEIHRWMIARNHLGKAAMD
jgi:acyl-CoA dehydrogenase